MKLIALIAVLAVSLPTAARASSCCEHEEKSTAAATESIYQLDATWTNQHGKKMSLSDLGGRPVLITMGYATCKFACPRLAADLLGIEKRLSPAEREKLAIVFVSIDPRRDTPAALKTFLGRYRVEQQRWHGLRGGDDAVLELSVALGIRYRKVNDTDFAHSNIIAVLSPDGEIVHRLEGLGVDPAPLLAALRPLLAPKTAESLP